MSPALTQREQNANAFASVMPKAQEAVLPVGEYESRLAFKDAVSRAQEDRESAGRLNATHYGPQRGKATCTKNTFRIIPTKSDFVCDVYNTARRILSAEDFSYFVKFYLCDRVEGIYPLGIADMNNALDKTSTGEDKFLAAHLNRYVPNMRRTITEFDRSLREKLGAAFIKNGIYPVRSYYNEDGVDVRIQYEQAIN